MKKDEIMNKMSGAFNNVSFKMKKHSPEILMVAGVAGVVVSAVMACKAASFSSCLPRHYNTLPPLQGQGHWHAGKLR